MALYLGAGVRMSRIEIEQVLCGCLISVLIESVTLLERKLERTIQFLRRRSPVADLYVDRGDSDRFALANLYMKCHFVLAEGEIVVYVRVVVSMRFVKALDMSQIICESLRIKVRKRLPDLIPGTLFRRHHGDHRISRESVCSREVDLLQLVVA